MNELDCFLKTFLQMYRKKLPHPFQTLSLYQAIQYSLLDNKAKRMRPLLLFKIGALFDIPTLALCPPAASIECLHTYSLVHDDLPAMDNDILRRGKFTCHAAFDESTAILVGDALQTLAFEILTDKQATSFYSETQLLKMIQTLAQACGAKGMIAGQALDMANTQNVLNKTKIELKTLKQLHKFKTGKLFQASVTLGLIAANVQDSQIVSDFNDFGMLVGLAFQIKDDLLDRQGHSKNLGKTAGLDKINGKSTFPELLGIDESKRYLNELIEQAKARIAKYDRKDTLTVFLEKVAERAY